VVTSVLAVGWTAYLMNLANTTETPVAAAFSVPAAAVQRSESVESLTDGQDYRFVRLQRDELTKALRRQAEAATKYGPKHPEMQKIAADVAKAQAELGNEISKIIRNLKTEFEVSSEGERNQAARLDTLKGRIADSRDKQWRLRELEREVLASKQLYEALLTRNKQTVETQGLQFADARLVESADVPLYPASPKRRQLVGFAAGSGLALGLALAMLLELGASGIARPQDVERGLELPHLGSVPALEPNPMTGLDPLKAIRLTVAEPRGAFSEAIRGVRHALDGHGRRHGPSVVLVASSLPCEGRTVIASNLALQYAGTNRRTLLIDADLRRAELSFQLGLDGSAGLADALARPTDINASIVHDRATGLFVLPAASRPDFGVDAPALLDSPRFSQLVGYLRSQFDIIVLDAPPLLPVIDARIVANQADSIVFVTAWRRTPRAIGRNALRSLGANGEKVVGVVVNQVSPAAISREFGLTGNPYATPSPRVA